MNWTIRNGTVLGAEGLERTDFFIDGGILSDRGNGGREIDAAGLLVLPGIVDIHGDGFERQIMPRPGVRFDVGLALRDTDRQLVANGITTAFHGVTVSWEPGLRSLQAAGDFVTALATARPHLACWARRKDVAGAIEELAAAARENSNVLLAHDEASPDERRHFRALGAVSSEFPLTLETAAEARAAGEHVILGAPNVVRGGSHNGALDATTAIRDGLCTVLASDYHYPSPLLAAFRLASPEDADFAKAWHLVSANAAAAAGLADRGRFEREKRADVILVDAKDIRHPKVVATLVGGRLVYSALTLIETESAIASAAV